MSTREIILLGTLAGALVGCTLGNLYLAVQRDSARVQAEIAREKLMAAEAAHRERKPPAPLPPPLPGRRVAATAPPPIWPGRPFRGAFRRRHADENGIIGGGRFIVLPVPLGPIEVHVGFGPGEWDKRHMHVFCSKDGTLRGQMVPSVDGRVVYLNGEWARIGSWDGPEFMRTEEYLKRFAVVDERRGKAEREECEP